MNIEICDACAESIERARQISRELGDLPLALDQAGAYIDETKCYLTRYLQQYRQRRAELLARRGKVAKDYPRSVATTWSLAFEKVEQRSPLAAQILRLCSFLAANAILEELMEYALAAGALSPTQTPEQEPAPPPTSEQESNLDEIVVVLRAYSLIQRNPQESTLAVHRLVQEVQRDAMPEEERQTWAERAVSLLRMKLPALSFENWQQCEQYVPHTQECLSFTGESSAEQARVLHWIGAYLLERQRTQEAGGYIQQALQFRELRLGKAHLETAASLDRLARWWELQGRYAEAEPLYQRSLAISEQQLGTKHPSTAMSLNNLAVLYYYQKRYGEAEPLLKRACIIWLQRLGAEHPTIQSALQTYAILLQTIEERAGAKKQEES